MFLPRAVVLKAQVPLWDGCFNDIESNGRPSFCLSQEFPCQEGSSLDLALTLMGQETHGSIYKDPSGRNYHFWVEMDFVVVASWSLSVQGPLLGPVSW